MIGHKRGAETWHRGGDAGCVPEGVGKGVAGLWEGCGAWEMVQGLWRRGKGLIGRREVCGCEVGWISE